ncbi:T9SS type A sorting domain-containing protein, partial [Flavobacterium pedocola]
WAPTGGTAATATGLAAGTYTCTITDANGCQTTRSFTINQPAVIDSSVTLSGSTLTANQTGATYQWIDCNNANAPVGGETNITFTPAISGNYAVIVTIGSCTATSICTNVLDAATFETAPSLVVYPNPTNGVINIKTNFEGRFQIMNQLGQIVKSFTTFSGVEQTIEINAAAGVYFLTGQSKDGKTVNRKIILDK